MSKVQIIKVVAITQKRQKVSLARCFCGKKFYVFEQNVNSGNTRSCGCLTRTRKAVFELSSGHADKSYWHWLDKIESKDL